MQSKVVAVCVENEYQFNIVIQHMIEFGYETQEPVKSLNKWKFKEYFEPVHTQYIEFCNNPGRFDSNFHFMDRYEIVSFNTFCVLAGIKFTEKPKEVILEWRGSFVNINAKVTKGNVVLSLSKSLAIVALSEQQLTELSTALKSLEDGQ